MHRRVILRLISTGLVALGTTAIGAIVDGRHAVAANRIKLGAGEWPPYFSQSLKHNGSFAYIVTQAFAAAGYDVEYSFLPWKRALQEAEDGVLDGSPGWKSTPERAQSFLFSDPVITSTSVLFHLKGTSLDWSTIDDLMGRRIGITAGYSYGTDFDAAVADKRLIVDAAKDDLTALRMLLAKRTELVVMNRDVGFDIMHRSLLPSDAAAIIFNEKPIDQQPSFLAISKKTPHAEQVIADFNRGLAKIRGDGVIDQVARDLANGLFY